MTGSSKQDDRARGVAAWAALLRTHATLVKILERQTEQTTGLPLSWYDVLLELNAAEGRRLRMQQLAERVVLSRTRISRVVDEMVAAGLVQKTSDTHDRRSTFATITERGRTALRDAAPVYLDGIDKHFTRHLRESEVRAIKTGLERVLDAHGAWRYGKS